jgi:hypothetical protein
MVDATQTIQNSYSVVKMPDGSEVLMQKMSDGKWVTVDERLEHSQSLTDRFASTNSTLKPHDWKPPSSGNVHLKSGAVRDINYFIKSGSTTHMHLHAHLIEVLGDPNIILQAKTLDRKINDPSIRRNITKMIEALNCHPWNDVLKIMDA